MAVPKEMIWPRDPHTEAKHSVLGGYYDAWFPIMLQGPWDSLTVFEGYAGPGEYSGGEEGSPLIAMRRLLDRPDLVELGKPVRFVFVEARRDRLEHLQHLIAERFPEKPGHIKVTFREGECERVWESALTWAGAWGHPIFANLDPFGPGVPYSLVRRLGKNAASEALVTFMSDWLRRFATLEEHEDGDRQYGSKKWRKVQTRSSPEEKELFLIDEYRRTLSNAGLGLTAPFKLVDEGGHAFYLIFATGHLRGLERMKESMWKTDPVRGIEFRDPQDPDQGLLDLGAPEPSLSPLRNRLKANMTPGTWYTVEELRNFALTNTAFRDTHVPHALRRMLSDDELSRDPDRGQLSKKVRVRLA